MRKQPIFRDHSTVLVYPRNMWRLRNDCRNSTLVTCRYPDLGSASDWSCREGYFPQAIRSTTHIWVVRHHQYGISALVPQTPIRGETMQWRRREISPVLSRYRYAVNNRLIKRQDGNARWRRRAQIKQLAWPTAFPLFHAQLTFPFCC